MKDNDFSHYLETSAKSGQNVNDLFQTITKQLFLLHESNLDKFRDEDEASEHGASFISLNEQPRKSLDVKKVEKKKKCCK